MNLTFVTDTNISDLFSNCRMGIVSSLVKVDNNITDLVDAISSAEIKYADSLQVRSEAKLPIIDETRRAYKSCGKEPSRYRPSAEALLRRIRTGKGLYKINNVVDTINLLSITSNFSIGGFNSLKIEGDVILDIGNSAPYEAIGRGHLNIESMPGLRDDLGFFGTPTSDSIRTMVTPDIEQLVLVYYDFFGNDRLDSSLEIAAIALEKYCSGSNIETQIIG